MFVPHTIVALEARAKELALERESTSLRAAGFVERLLESIEGLMRRRARSPPSDGMRPEQFREAGGLKECSQDRRVLAGAVSIGMNRSRTFPDAS